MGKRAFLNICENCHGYTEGGETVYCPVCGGILAFKPIDAKEKSGYKNLDRTDPLADIGSGSSNDPLADIGVDDTISDNSPFMADDHDSDDAPVSGPAPVSGTDRNSGIFPGTGRRSDSDNSQPVIAAPQGKRSGVTLLGEQIFRGTVFNYKNTENDFSNYSRNIFVKLVDAIVYHQRTEDVLHYFRLHTESGKNSDGTIRGKNINVNVHGTIVGGAHIYDNSSVTVKGRFKNGVLMASRVEDNESGSVVIFRRAVKTTSAILAIVGLLIVSLIFGLKNGSSIASFFGNMRTFLTTALIVYVVLIVLFLITGISKLSIFAALLSQRGLYVPWVGLGVVSLGISYLLLSFISSGGPSAIGSAASSCLSSQAFTDIVVYLVLILILISTLKTSSK